MKIAVWNCNQAFRRKRNQLLKHDPDIAIVPECENPAMKGDWSEFSDWTWTGSNQNQGLGIFARNGVTISSTTTTEEADYCLHAETSAGDILAVWAMNDETNPERRYIGQIYTALTSHPELIDENTIVAGDFNWNVIWDDSPKSPLCGDFANTREVLNRIGLCSAYHTERGDTFGEETEATFYMHKKEQRTYHTDYSFVPKHQIESGIEVIVGKYDDWIDASDHMPLFLTL